MSFLWPVRIYWEDTDAGGIVYYANYLKFMERARSEWLRSIGVEQGVLQLEHGLMFVVVAAETHFHKPARYGELLLVSCEIDESRRASLTFRQNIVRGGGTDGAEDGPAGSKSPGNDSASGALLVSARVRVACLDAQKFRPRPLPAAVLRAMNVAGDG